MKFFNKSLNTIALAGLLLVSTLASAEQKKQLGPWDVHYIAMPSTLIATAESNAFEMFDELMPRMPICAPAPEPPI